MIVIAPARPCPTPMPWLAAANDDAGGVFGDRDAGLTRPAPRRAPGCGLFGRRDTDPPLMPADGRPRPPSPDTAARV